MGSSNAVLVGALAASADSNQAARTPTKSDAMISTRPQVSPQQTYSGNSLRASELLLASTTSSQDGAASTSTDVVPSDTGEPSTAAATRLDGVRWSVSQAGDQLGQSLRQLYASASSIATGAVASNDVPPSYHNIPGIVPYYRGRSVGPPPSYDDVINPYAPPPTYQSLFGQMREARKSSHGLLDLLRRLLIILISTLGCTILIAFMILIPFTMIIVGALYLDECKIEHIPAFLLVGGLVWAAKNLLHCYSQCRKVEQQEQSEALAAQLYLAAATANSATAITSSSSSAHSFVGSTVAPPSERRANQLQRSVSSSSSSAARAATLGASSASLSSSSSSSSAAAAAAMAEAAASVPSAEAAERNTSRFKSSVCESLLNCVLAGWFIAGCVIVLRNYEPDFENPASARYCHRTVYMYTFWLISSALLSIGLFVGCICCLMISSALANRQPDLEV